MNEENNILTIKTVQIQPIRNMITAIKDILTDATITFTKEGMKIINFDKTQTILVNVFLNADRFEKYECLPDKVIICANTLHLFKVISTMSNDDTLSIYILTKQIIMTALYHIWDYNTIMVISNSVTIKNCV